MIIGLLLGVATSLGGRALWRLDVRRVLELLPLATAQDVRALAEGVSRARDPPLTMFCGPAEQRR